MISLTQIISLFTAMGIGGIIGVIIKHVLDKNAELKIKLKTINEEKYRTILIYMSIIIDPQNKDHFILNDNILENLRNDTEIQKYAISKLKEYYYQSVLYASNEVLESFKNFLLKPDRQNYLLAAQNMRMDLWNNKTKILISEI